MEKNTKISLIAIVAVAAGLGMFSSLLTLQISPNSEMSIIFADVTPDEIAEIADYAIIGEVIGQKSVLIDMPNANDMDKVITVITLKVHEDLFGNYQKPLIDFRIYGGEVDSMKLVAHNSPQFETNEIVMVYLEKAVGGENPLKSYHNLIGGGQSVFEFLDDGRTIQDRSGNGEQFNKETIKQMTKKHYGLK